MDHCRSSIIKSGLSKALGLDRILISWQNKEEDSSTSFVGIKLKIFPCSSPIRVS